MKNLYENYSRQKRTQVYIFCVYLTMGKWWNQGCHGRSQLFPSCDAFSFNWATKEKFVHVRGIIWDISKHLTSSLGQWTFNLSLPNATIISLRSYLYVICSSFVVIMFFCHFHHLVSLAMSSRQQIQKAFFSHIRL